MTAPTARVLWSWADGRGPPIPEGVRNLTLTRIAGSLRGRGLEYAGILGVLLATNVARCRPPLRDAEVRTIAKSVSRYRPGPPRVAAPVGSDSRKAIVGVVDRGHPPLCSTCHSCLTDSACRRCGAALCGHCGNDHRCGPVAPGPGDVSEPVPTPETRSTGLRRVRSASDKCGDTLGAALK